MFVSVLASENFLSKSSLSTLVAPRLKTKALLLKIMNPIPLSPNFARILLLSTALIVSISTAIAGGRSGERNLMDDYLQSKTSVNSSASSAIITVIYNFYKFFTFQIQK
jgi:hypothetical protein